MGGARRPRPRRDAERRGRPRRRRRELVDLIVSDVGKPITEARAEVARAAMILRYAASLATAPAGEVYEDATGASVRVLRFPRGVALLITPWNFPIAIPVWKLAPALQAGNAVVLKPATQALRIAQRLVEHLDLGDVVQLVPGGARRADALLDARPDAVSFTGSTATGRSIAERLAGAFVPLQLEMGGKNGVYVSEAADAGAGREGRARRRDGLRRAEVHGDVAAVRARAREDAVLAELRTQTAALASATRRRGHGRRPADRRRQARRGAAQLAGAETLAGGDARGTRCSPRRCSPASTRPTRGAVRARAVRPDGRGHGRGARAPGRARVRPGGRDRLAVRDEVEAFARRAEAGIVRVNAPTAGVEPHVPFGGAKKSSFGPREQGRAGLEFFSETRTIYG